MPLIEWKPEFSVGIKDIDEQHKGLMSTINTLHNAMGEGKGREVLAEIFNNLIAYTTTHFKTEEIFMTTFSYPDYSEHKEAHDKCVSKVIEFKNKFDKGDVRITIALSIFLVGWLHEHLLKMDMKYVPFFHEKGLS